MLFSILHEIGHIIAGILLGFKPITLEILPVGLAVQLEGKSENYNKKIKKGTMLNLKKIIIAIAGPMVNVIIAIIFFVIDIHFFNIRRDIIIYANIIIAIFNSIPIYPLDGGRIVKNMLNIFEGRIMANKYINLISNITISILTAISSIWILYCKNIAILLVLAYLWIIIIKQNKIWKNKQKIYDKIKELA